MKLLSEVPTILYCIKADYFMWSEENGEYKEPLYWCLDQSKYQLIVFEEKLNPRVRVFDTFKKAKNYFNKHNVSDCFCYDNPRIVAIAYNFNEKRWEEVQ